MPGKFVLLNFNTVYAEYLEGLRSGIWAVAWQSLGTSTEKKTKILSHLCKLHSAGGLTVPMHLAPTDLCMPEMSRDFKVA